MTTALTALLWIAVVIAGAVAGAMVVALIKVIRGEVTWL